MKLVLPTTKYKESFLEALKDYQSVDAEDRLDILALSIDELEQDFPAYIEQLLSESQGKNLPAGYVPQGTYWLIDREEFIGRVSIRHTLTKHLLREGGNIGYDIRPSKRKNGYGKEILALTLPKAKELGMQKVLITCNETNLGSQKIIEANGGILENRIDIGKDKPRKLRYWITL